jgi:hypothetical protein
MPFTLISFTFIVSIGHNESEGCCMERQWRSGKVRKRGEIYWIDVYVDGRRIRETTGARTEHEALAFLERRVAEIQGGSTSRTVNELLDTLEDEYELAGKLDPSQSHVSAQGHSCILRKDEGRERHSRPDNVLHATSTP